MVNHKSKVEGGREEKKEVTFGEMAEMTYIHNTKSIPFIGISIGRSSVTTLQTEG